MTENDFGLFVILNSLIILYIFWQINKIKVSVCKLADLLVEVYKPVSEALDMLQHNDKVMRNRLSRLEEKINDDKR